MPRVDGLTALRMLMERSPRPVVMFEQSDGPAARDHRARLGLGAVDFIQKPSVQSGTGFTTIAEELTAKVKRAAHAGCTAARGAGPGAGEGGGALARPSRLADGLCWRAAPADRLGAAVAGHGVVAPALLASRAAPERVLVVGSSTGRTARTRQLTVGAPPGRPAGGGAHRAASPGGVHALAVRAAEPGQRAGDCRGAGPRPARGRPRTRGPGRFSSQARRLPRRARPGPAPPRRAAVGRHDAPGGRGRGLRPRRAGGHPDGHGRGRHHRGAGREGCGRHCARGYESTCVVYGMPRSVIMGGSRTRSCRSTRWRPPFDAISPSCWCATKEADRCLMKWAMRIFCGRCGA